MKKKTTLGILGSTDDYKAGVSIDTSVGKKSFCGFHWGELNRVIVNVRKAPVPNLSEYKSCKIIVPTVFL